MKAKDGWKNSHLKLVSPPEQSKELYCVHITIELFNGCGQHLRLQLLAICKIEIFDWSKFFFFKPLAAHPRCQIQLLPLAIDTQFCVEG